jgi:hypothetical protein
MTTYFEYTEIGLVVTGQPTIDDWRKEYQSLKTDAKGFYRRLGDMQVYGQLTYGDLIDQENDETDCDDPTFNPGTLYNAKYVSSRWWPVERRIYDLPWSFYQETAPLKIWQQDAVMAEAESEGWNRDKLRKVVADYQKLNGKREHVPIRPDDIIFDQQQKMNRMQEQLDQMKQVSNAALDDDDDLPLPDELPTYVGTAIGSIRNFLRVDSDEYSAVVIHSNGNVEWIAK